MDFNFTGSRGGFFAAGLFHPRFFGTVGCSNAGFGFLNISFPILFKGHDGLISYGDEKDRYHLGFLIYHNFIIIFFIDLGTYNSISHCMYITTLISCRNRLDHESIRRFSCFSYRTYISRYNHGYQYTRHFLGAIIRYSITCV